MTALLFVGAGGLLVFGAGILTGLLVRDSPWGEALLRQVGYLPEEEKPRPRPRKSTPAPTERTRTPAPQPRPEPRPPMPRPPTPSRSPLPAHRPPEPEPRPEPVAAPRQQDLDRSLLVAHWQRGLEERQGNVEAVFAGLVQTLGTSARIEPIVSDGGRRVAIHIHVGPESWIVPDFQTRLLELEKWFDLAAGSTRSSWISTLHQPALERGDSLERGVVS